MFGLLFPPKNAVTDKKQNDKTPSKIVLAEPYKNDVTTLSATTVANQPTIAQQLRPCIKNQGRWEISRNYMKNDVVIFHGQLYLCIVSETGRTMNNPSRANDYWMQLAANPLNYHNYLEARGEWMSNREYKKYDMVLYMGNNNTTCIAYLCIVDHSCAITFPTTEWLQLGQNPLLTTSDDSIHWPTRLQKVSNVRDEVKALKDNLEQRCNKLEQDFSLKMRALEERDLKRMEDLSLQFQAVEERIRKLKDKFEPITTIIYPSNSSLFITDYHDTDRELIVPITPTTHMITFYVGVVSGRSRITQKLITARLMISHPHDPEQTVVFCDDSSKLVVTTTENNIGEKIHPHYDIGLQSKTKAWCELIIEPTKIICKPKHLLETLHKLAITVVQG